MPEQEYWNERWKENKTGWDIGYASPPLVEYLDHLKNRDIRILIPGSGSGYEAEYAFKNGFQRVYYNDISPEAALGFQKRFPEFPTDQIMIRDFFDLQGKYDLILEQTSFCAQRPEKRKQYVDKVHELLNPGGCYAGVLFDQYFSGDSPPYGGDENEYRKLFIPKFNINKMEKCYNSIIPRQGKELFVLLSSK